MGKNALLNARTLNVSGVLIAATLLSGCEEAPKLAFLQPADKTEKTPKAQNATQTGDRDVEAPEVFNTSEAGLWDGRPSLGGVWVAHPDVTEPERVIIRNTSNDKFVVGALFRREREIPGPRLQASSGAAEALGMLAGAPVKLEVTALRREEITPEPPTPTEDTAEETTKSDDTSDSAKATAPAPAAVATTSLPPAKPAQDLDKTLSDAAAAIDASSDAAAQTTAAATDGLSDPSVATPETGKAKRKGLFGGLFAKKNKETGPELASLEGDDALLAAADPAPAAKPAPKPTSSLDKPFIQVGIFSVEANASRAAKQMGSAGMLATIRQQELNGKPFWRVVVGPATNKSERSALLKSIKTEGYTDAYTVSN